MKPAFIVYMDSGRTFKFVIMRPCESICEIMKFFTGDKPSPKSVNIAWNAKCLDPLLSGAVIMAADPAVSGSNQIRQRIKIRKQISENKSNTPESCKLHGGGQCF